MSGTPLPALAALLLVTAAQTGAALLVVSGLRHGRHRSELVHHLRRHRVVPDRAVYPLSHAVPLGSVAVGAAALGLPTLVAGLAPAAWLPVQRAVAGAQALVYLVFLGYLVLLRVRAPGESCGCLGAAEGRAGAAIARAAGLAAVTLAAGLAARPVTSVAGWPSRYLLATAIGVLAGAFWAVHAAHRQPIDTKGRLA